MVAAKRILVIVSFLFMIGVVLQFFFAGLSLLGGEEDWDLHKGFGWAALHFTPVLILILAYLAKMGRTMLFLALALAIVSLIQPFWVTEFRGEFLGSMHVLGALVIFTLAHHVAQRGMRGTRGASE